MPPNVICAEENTGGRVGEGGVGGGGCVQITLFNLSLMTEVHTIILEQSNFTPL